MEVVFLIVMWCNSNLQMSDACGRGRTRAASSLPSAAAWSFHRLWHEAAPTVLSYLSSVAIATVCHTSSFLQWQKPHVQPALGAASAYFGPLTEQHKLTLINACFCVWVVMIKSFCLSLQYCEYSCGGFLIEDTLKKILIRPCHHGPVSHTFAQCLTELQGLLPGEIINRLT